MATTTINTTAAEDTRIVVAFGHILNTKDASGNPRNATQAEVKAELIRYGLVQRVLEDEQYQQALAAKAGVTQISPT